MAKTKTSAMPVNEALSGDARKVFLQHLAETANVSEAAKVAGISTWTVYKTRLSSVGFRKQWQRSLAQGYARLEAYLLSEALSEPVASADDPLHKEREQQRRLALTLLQAHRATVRGEAVAEAKPTPSTGSKRSGTAAKRLEAKFAQMFARMSGANDAC